MVTPAQLMPLQLPPENNLLPINRPILTLLLQPAATTENKQHHLPKKQTLPITTLDASLLLPEICPKKAQQQNLQTHLKITTLPLPTPVNMQDLTNLETPPPQEELKIPTLARQTKTTPAATTETITTSDNNNPPETQTPTGATTPQDHTHPLHTANPGQKNTMPNPKPILRQQMPVRTPDLLIITNL